MARVAPRVTLLPGLAAAALRAREGTEMAAHAILRAALQADGDTGTTIRRAAAVGILAETRGIAPRTAREIVQRGEGKYWTVESGRRGTDRGVDRLRLLSSGAIGFRLGVERWGRAQTVPIELLRSRRDVTASLYAVACHELPNHSGEIVVPPRTRATKAQQTGLSARQQQRLDATGATQLIERLFARVQALPTAPGGVFTTSRGVRLRRIADVRVPFRHRNGSRSTSRNARRTAARLRDPGADTGNFQGRSVPRPGNAQPRRGYKGRDQFSALEAWRRSGTPRAIIEYPDPANRSRRVRVLVERGAA